MSRAEGRAVGIDLGTTYTAVACLDEYGKPMVLKNADGQPTTPSAVFFDPPHYVVGETAVQSTQSDPERVAQFVKRFIGQPNFRVPAGSRFYSPEFVSAIILRKVVQDAEAELGEPVTRAVITVPAYFTETQRQATYEAGRMAGLHVLRIINEPTAAALAYGMLTRRRERFASPRRVLVYDLGGGTFDVTVLQVENDELNVLAIGGDARLGGKDFDDRIMAHVEEKLRESCGFDVSDDPGLEAELRLKATTAKRQLSGREVVPISLKVPSASGATPVKVELSRECFEELTADLLVRTELMLSAVLSNANLKWGDISDVLCVGGSSRMPMVGAMLQRVSGRQPLLHDPDECVAKGAAIQAALIEAEARAKGGDSDYQVPSVSVGHVLAHSLGVAVLINGTPQIDHVIPALTRLPVTQVRHGYTTTTDGQEFVQIRIYEGESHDPQSYGKGPVGVFNLPTANPPRPAGQPNISVAFRCDENGRIMAAARDRDTGQESRLAITLQGRRTSAEMSEEAQLLDMADIA